MLPIEPFFALGKEEKMDILMVQLCTIVSVVSFSCYYSLALSFLLLLLLFLFFFFFFLLSVFCFLFLVFVFGFVFLFFFFQFLGGLVSIFQGFPFSALILSCFWCLFVYFCVHCLVNLYFLFNGVIFSEEP
jgi:hypothetical protein